MHLIEYRLEWLILHRDQIRCFFGHVRILRQRHGDRLAGIPYFFERENRLIVKCRAVVWIGNEPADVVAGDHRIDTIERERGARINAEDFAVRNRAASNLPVEHSRQREVVNVFRAAGDLGLALQPPDGTFDLARGWRFALGLRWLDYLRLAFPSSQRRARSANPIGRSLKRSRVEAERRCRRGGQIAKIFRPN